MLARLALLVLLPLFAAAAFGGVFFYFYQGGYDEPDPVDIPYHEIPARSAASGKVADSPGGQERHGLLLVDAQHVNAFAEGEIVSLTSKVADRGFEVEFVGNFAPLEDPAQIEPRLQQLAAKLWQADSFVVILPQMGFSDAESALVESFVRKGGKLLLVSDPSRPQQINTLAERFGLDFQPDYLYNTVENDLNFRNIFVRDFQPDRLTAGLGSVTLYMAGSIRSPGPGLAFIDANTKSSLLESAGDLSPMAWGDSRNVLAVADLSFMVPPQDSLLDNDKLVSNIADYLTDSGRTYDLADFPYFYETSPDNRVDILVGRSSLLSAGLQVKSGLAAYRLSSKISPVEDLSRDTVFLGLYVDAPQVAPYLQTAGVRVDDTLSTPFTQDLGLAGNGIIVLDRGQDGRYVLIVLADTPEILAATVAALISGEYRSGLLGDFVGVHKFVGMGE